MYEFFLVYELMRKYTGNFLKSRRLDSVRKHVQTL